MKSFMLRLTAISIFIVSISACATPVSDRGEYMRERDSTHISIPNYSGGKWSFSAGLSGNGEYLSKGFVSLVLSDKTTMVAVAYRVEGGLTTFKDQLLPDLDSLATDIRPLAEKVFSEVDRKQFDSAWEKTISQIETEIKNQLSLKANTRGLMIDKVTIKVILPAPK